MEIVTVASGDTLHGILWRRDRGRTAEAVQATLALNPGLAALGPLLPAGTRIRLAPAPSEGGEREAAIVRLWGKG